MRSMAACVELYRLDPSRVPKDLTDVAPVSDKVSAASTTQPGHVSPKDVTPEAAPPPAVSEPQLVAAEKVIQVEEAREPTAPVLSAKKRARTVEEEEDEPLEAPKVSKKEDRPKPKASHPKPDEGAMPKKKLSASDKEHFTTFVTTALRDEFLRVLHEVKDVTPFRGQAFEFFARLCLHEAETDPFARDLVNEVTESAWNAKANANTIARKIVVAFTCPPVSKPSLVTKYHLVHHQVNQQQAALATVLNMAIKLLLGVKEDADVFDLLGSGNPSTNGLDTAHVINAKKLLNLYLEEPDRQSPPFDFDDDVTQAKVRFALAILRWGLLGLAFSELRGSNDEASHMKVVLGKGGLEFRSELLSYAELPLDAVRISDTEYQQLRKETAGWVESSVPLHFIRDRDGAGRLVKQCRGHVRRLINFVCREFPSK